MGPMYGMSQPTSSRLERRRYGALGVMVRSFRRSRLCSSTGGEMLADMVAKHESAWERSKSLGGEARLRGLAR